MARQTIVKSAFPVVPHTSVSSYGMSLRDYIAIKAMAAYVARGYDNPKAVSQYAYEMADAMLAQGEK